MVALGMLLLTACTVARAATYQWLGASNSVWATAGNWSNNLVAPTGGSFGHRLNVTNPPAGFECLYDASLGTTVYGSNGVRGLVVGSTGNGNFRVTGGTFATTNGTASVQDVICSSSASTQATFTNDGGTYISWALELGLNNPNNGTLTLNAGTTVISNLQYNFQNGAGAVNLNGGTLTTWIISRITATPGTSAHVFNFNGGTLIAGGSNTNFVGNTVITRANVRDGGAKIDTAGNDITILQPLQHSNIGGDAATDGGLTKLGLGTLTLAGTNDYSGDTIVAAGTLRLSQPTLAGGSEVTVSNAAVLHLDFNDTNAVRSLVLNGVVQPPGIYSSNTSSPYLTGPGSLDVTQITGVITLNPTTTYQRIYGIGGNFCQGDQKILDAYNRYSQVFSESGLNFSFIRLSTSFEMTNTRFADYDDVNVAVTTNFRAMQPDGYITLSSWSPPENLKSTASAYGGTLAKVGGQYVYTNFANWWVRTMQFYQSNSALPDYLSIQNEPDFTSSNTNAAWGAGSYLNSTETATKAGYPEALSAVRSALAAAGLGSQKIVGPDTTAIGSGKIPNYLTNASPATVDAIGHHLYGDAPATSTSRLSTLDTQYPYAAWPKFMTEANPFDDQETYAPTNQPDWMHLAVTLHNVFVYERANTYLVWNVMYGTVGYWNGLPVGTETYYPLGHYSKFVRPGALRANVTTTDPNVLVSLYRHTNSPGVADKLVFVLINKSSNYSYLSVLTSNHWAADPPQRAWKVYQTANDGPISRRLTLITNESGAGLAGNRSLALPPYSITTAIINTGFYTNAPPYFTSTASSPTINPGQTLLVTNTAADPNLPAQTLTFSLPLAPPGSSLNPSNGILSWRPLIAQASSANPFRVVVTDNGTPALSATQSFGVYVSPVTQPSLTTPALSNGQFQMSVGGMVGPDYTVQATTNLTMWTNLFVTNPLALPFGWSDPATPNFTRRFYRVLLGP